MSLASAIAAIDYIGLLTWTCTIQHPTRTGTDSGGQPIYDYTTDVDTDVMCRPTTGGPEGQKGLTTASMDAGEHVVIADLMMFLKIGQTISKTDRVTCLVSADGLHGYTSKDATGEDLDTVYDVVGNPSDAAGQGHHREVLLKGVN